MNKKNFIISLILSIALLGLSIYFIIEYAKSFGVYDDGYGTEIYSDADWLVLSISAILLLIFAIYSTIQAHKNLPVNPNAAAFLGLTVSAIAAFYPLGVFIKAMIKGKDYLKYHWYLYIGLVGTILLCGFIFFSIKAYKKYKASH